MILIVMMMIISVFGSNKKESASGNSESTVMASFNERSNLVKIEENEYVKANSSNYFGVTHNEESGIWRAYRHSKTKSKRIYNGSYKSAETAARASDTLARLLNENGEKGHKLNFSDDDAEVWADKSSAFIGVSYNKLRATWNVRRRSKKEDKIIHNGTYKKEETAAIASDTLANVLIANGERGHKLNFPDNDTEVWAKENNSDYIGVNHKKKQDRWIARRWSKTEKKMVFNGCYYKTEEIAAHASDTLARKLIRNGEKGHKLNFPDDNSEVNPKNQNKKRKKPADFENSQKSDVEDYSTSNRNYGQIIFQSHQVSKIRVINII